MRTSIFYTYFVILTLTVFLFPNNLFARSSWRKQLEQLPCITTEWFESHEGILDTISDAHIEPYPLFCAFNQDHFNANKVQNTSISYEENGLIKTVDSSLLSDLCETLIQEVMNKKRKFTHFTILQKKNFNRKHMCGLLVVKFNNYPFVVKLFIENPTSLINYWCKGFEPIFFWNMGKGAGRHLCGLTRIRNREIIEQKLSENPFQEATIKIPRKWFWEPYNNPYIKITGTDMGLKQEKYTTLLPGIYAIIADYINIKDNTLLSTTEKNQISMKLCNHLELIIDPHANNYIFSVDQKSNKLCITLIDTEYFPMMVGLKEKKKFTNHFEWYTFLVEKCFTDTFYQPKHIRMQSLTQQNELLFSYI